MTAEFEEIAHSGGKIIIEVVETPDGQRGIQFTHTNSRPNPSTLIGVYAIPPGIVIGSYSFGIRGSEPPPVPGAIPVPVACDTEGLFGHNCPQCSAYWRSGPFPRLCPYCRCDAPSHNFLSQAQRQYVSRYCELWQQAELREAGARFEIDLDAIADATLKGTPKPEFYISEERQQTAHKCAACGNVDDLLGRFGYCSSCGTRNDFNTFAEKIVPEIRVRLDSGSAPESCLRDAVSAFDTMLNQYGRQLAVFVPMTARRRVAVEKGSFPTFQELAASYSAWFDIDLRGNIAQSDWDAAIRSILRRHIYEHNGGVVDQKYIDKSGDRTVRLGQRINETPQSVHPFLATLVSISKRLHEGFHNLLPPFPEPIKHHQEKLARRKPG